MSFEPEAPRPEEAPITPFADAAYPPPSQTTLRPHGRGVFTGRFGLRAGWGLLLWLILTVTFITGIQLGTLAAQGKLQEVMQKRHEAAARKAKGLPKPPAPATPAPAMQAHDAGVGELGLFAAVLLSSFLVVLIERRRFGVLGIGSHGFANFFPGAFWGLASLSLLVLVLKSTHLLFFDARLLFGKAMLLYGAKWLVVFLLVGLFEEFFFRGYFQYALTRGFFGLGEKLSVTHARALAFLFASVITSAVFFVAHTGNAGETAWGLFAVFLAGVVFTYALWRTGSLWWAIGFHMAWDWAQSFLYGVPDSGGLSAGRLFQTHAAGNPVWSGGTDGPEGSVLVIPTLALVLLIIRLTRSGAQPSLETTRPLADPNTVNAPISV